MAYFDSHVTPRIEALRSGFPLTDLGQQRSYIQTLSTLSSRDLGYVLPGMLKTINEGKEQLAQGFYILSFAHPGMKVLITGYRQDQEIIFNGFDITHLDLSKPGDELARGAVKGSTLPLIYFGIFLKTLTPEKQQALIDTFSEESRENAQTLFDMYTKPQSAITTGIAITDRIRQLLPTDRPVSPEELYSLVQTDNEYAFPPSFNQEAINRLNLVYYAHPDAFAGISKLFVSNVPVQQAFAKLIETLNPNQTQAIKILELACGNELRWPHIFSAIENNTRLQITLSDFTDSIIPNKDALIALGLNPEQFTRRSFNMTLPFPKIAESDRFNLIMTTYGFDSVWFAADKRYSKQNGVWYVSSYRLRMPEHIKQKDRENLLQVLRGEVDSSQISIELFKQIGIDEVKMAVNMPNEPLGQYVLERYDGLNDISCNVPGGLIEKVTEAFSTQLIDNGAFVIGDYAINTATLDPEFPLSANSAYATCGPIAKFKIEDYGLAQEILTKMGYHVDVINLRDFIDPFVNANDRESWASPNIMMDHFVMVVTNLNRIKNS